MTTRLHRNEYVGMAGGTLLAVSVFLPWYGTDSANRFAQIDGARGNQSCWDVHPILRWLLLAAAVAPFILAYIIANDVHLSWARGEMTLVTSIAAFGLIVYNGLIDRPGEPSSAISLKYGWFLAVLGTLAMIFGAALRSSEHERPAQATGNDMSDDIRNPPRSQPRPRARPRDRGGGAGRRAPDRHGRQGGRRPGGGRRHAPRARHRAHGRRRRHRRGGEGRGADALQRRAASATARRPRSTSPSTRSRARAWPPRACPSALAVIALSPRGTMFDPGPFVYMEKIAGGSDIADLLDLDRPLGETLGLIAERRGSDIRDIMVVVLDRPRHEEGIAAIREAGARVRLITDGDVERGAAGGLRPLAGRPAVGHRRHAGGRASPPPAIKAIRRRAGRPPVAARRGRAPGRRSTAATTSTARARPGRPRPGRRLLLLGHRRDRRRRAAGRALRGRATATTESIVMRSRTGTVRRISARHNRPKLRALHGRALRLTGYSGAAGARAATGPSGRARRRC